MTDPNLIILTERLREIAEWWQQATEAVHFIGANRGDHDHAKAWFDSRPVVLDPDDNRGWGWSLPGSFKHGTQSLLRLLNSEDEYAALDPRPLAAVSQAVLSYADMPPGSIPMQPDLDAAMQRVEAVLDAMEKKIKGQIAAKVAADLRDHAAPESKTNDVSKDLPALSNNAATVYEILLELPEYRAMTGSQIIEALRKRNVFISQSEFTSRIKPELDPYGIENRPRIGYRIPGSRRPKSS